MADKADIRELAVAAWRLEKWLDNLVSERKMAAKSALRGIKKYLTDMGVEVKDPVGSKFDPGLAVEVVNNEAESAPEEDLIIIETLTPYVYQHGELKQHARVIIGTMVKAAKANCEIRQDPAPGAVPARTAEEPKTAEPSVPAAPAGEAEEEVEIRADDVERMMAYAKIL